LQAQGNTELLSFLPWIQIMEDLLETPAG
jgi:hypothetical protein